MNPPQGNGGTTGGEGDGRSKKSLRRSIKKRTKSLCKKAYELATLCDVEVALVCYPSDGAEPTTWPPDRSKIEDAIHHYLDTPAHKKLPKNQITLDNPNPVDGKEKDAGKAAAKAEEKADRLRTPFPDDEGKLIALGNILDSRLEEVRKMIAVRRLEGRTDPSSSARDRPKKLGVAAESAAGGDPRPSAPDLEKNIFPGAAVAAVSAGGGDSGTSDRDRGSRAAEDCGPILGLGHPGFSAAQAPAPAPAPAPPGGGGAPNAWYPCPCRHCPMHCHWFTGWNGR